jgi:hypothetical protein
MRVMSLAVGSLRISMGVWGCIHIFLDIRLWVVL